MRLTLLLSLWLGITSLAVAGNATNRFALYLVADAVPMQQIIDGTAKPQGLKLQPAPIVADADLLAYDTTHHSFTITRPAAERVLEQCGRRLQVPFVVVADGEPVYVGVFTTAFSSISSGVPSILIDELRMPLNPRNTLQIDGGYPGGGRAGGKDGRSDQRVLAALQKLFRQRENKP